MDNHGKKEGLASAIAKAYTRKWSFLAAFVFVFFLTFSLLSTLGLTPEAPTKEEVKAPVRQPAVATLPEELPLTVEIPDIGVKVKVENPASTDVKILDEALLRGAVRYPASAKVGAPGNTILFGHSSYLPVVHNPAYKAFNKIQDLEKGDTITVYGNAHAYVYAVDNVYEADATEDAIPLTGSGHTLTLVTCDSFATKSDRFVVTATLVESYPLAK